MTGPRVHRTKVIFEKWRTYCTGATMAAAHGMVVVSDEALCAVTADALPPDLFARVCDHARRVLDLEYEPAPDALALTSGSFWLPTGRVENLLPPNNAIEEAARYLAAHSPAVRALAGDAVIAGVEWWQQEQDRDEAPKEMHTDQCIARAAPALAQNPQAAEARREGLDAADAPPLELERAHPLVASVLYLAGDGGPTVVLDQVREEAGWASGLVPRCPRVAALCPPRANRYLTFQGSLLHGVVRPLGAVDELEGADAPAWTRWTLLFNFWDKTPPGACAAPPEFNFGAAVDAGGASAGPDATAAEGPDTGGAGQDGQVHAPRPVPFRLVHTRRRAGSATPEPGAMLDEASRGRAAPGPSPAAADAIHAFADDVADHWSRSMPPPETALEAGAAGAPPGWPPPVALVYWPGALVAHCAPRPLAREIKSRAPPQSLPAAGSLHSPRQAAVEPLRVWQVLPAASSRARAALSRQHARVGTRMASEDDARAPGPGSGAQEAAATAAAWSTMEAEAADSGFLDALDESWPPP
mmetsp:Transcript_12213/g.36390  ORF Transcript_12213/g.36390 Transcript_12213/m.36390 type:complete len:528 (-) Transcript_12213:644-2227(-)